MFVHHTFWYILPEVIVDIIEDEEDEEAEAAVALARATLWKSSNKSHVWCSTLLAAAVMTSILSSKYEKI
jgi:Mg/Co/Ni transporter MgtE